MLNIFYMYSLVWVAIIVLYLFGWSDLCLPIEPQLWVFLIGMILTSAAVGFFFRKKFVFHRLEKNPHKNCLVTLLLVAACIYEFRYAGFVPLFKVLEGKGMTDFPFYGVPGLHFILTPILYIYCLYLFYLFLCFKKPSLLIEYIACWSYFILLYQRQNIIFVLMLTVWLFVGSINFKKWSRRKKLLALLGIFAFAFLALYAFGIIGNSRYGLWDWNDSSMIMEVGKINDRYPEWLPKEFTWAYIYFISPLANFNYNCQLGPIGGDLNSILYFVLPEFISQHFFTVSIAPSRLLSEALIVCTAFSDIFCYGGMASAYLLFGLLTAIVALVVWLIPAGKPYSIPLYVGASYFYILSFFYNPIQYPISAMIVMFAIGFGILLCILRAVLRHRKQKAAATLSALMPEIPASHARVSVAMASYNGERYIKEQIESILQNLTEEDELIISDDGSKDATLDIIRSYRDARVKLIEGPASGVVKNFENALLHCTGDYIFLCDQDDIWAPDKLTTVFPLLSSHLLVCHNADIYDQNSGEIVGDVQSQVGARDTFVANLWKNSFIGCCMAFRRELLEIALPFPKEAYIHVHDWWLSLLALRHGSVVFEPRSLIRYRIHDTNTLGFHKTSFAFKIKKRLFMLYALLRYGR